MTEFLACFVIVLFVLTFWLPLVVGTCVRSATRAYLTTRMGVFLASREVLMKEMENEKA